MANSASEHNKEMQTLTYYSIIDKFRKWTKQSSSTSHEHYKIVNYLEESSENYLKSNPSITCK